MGGIRSHGLTVDGALFWASVGALFLVIGVVGPFSTNDGPAHMSFAQMFGQGLVGPLQAEAYVVSRNLKPNMLMYVLAGPLVGLIGADWTEAIIQLLALAGLPMAACYAAAAFGRSGPMIALLALPLGLSQMFFFGLYNFCISLWMALVIFGAAVRAERGSSWNWAVMSVALLLAFFTHAGGFMIAIVLSAAWFAPPFLRDMFENPSRLARTYAFPLLAVAPSVAAMLWYLLDQSDTTRAQGPGPVPRLIELVKFDLLMVDNRITRISGRLSGALIMGLAGWASLARLRMWRPVPESRFETIRWAVLLGAAGLLALLFPDNMGGGWTHARRMAFAPYLVLLMICAAHPWRPLQRRAIMVAASALVAISLAANGLRQVEVRRLVDESDRLVAQVGPNCLLLQLFPDQGRFTPHTFMLYAPLFQIGTRIEHAGGRVSLPNYLARLGIYPVSYRWPTEPQVHLFGWEPKQEKPIFKQVDIEAFERASGLRVDYVLTESAHPELLHRVWQDRSGFRRIAQSDGGTFHLHARIGDGPDGTRFHCRDARLLTPQSRGL